MIAIILVLFFIVALAANPNYLGVFLLIIAWLVFYAIIFGGLFLLVVYGISLIG